MTKMQKLIAKLTDICNQLIFMLFIQWSFVRYFYIVPSIKRNNNNKKMLNGYEHKEPRKDTGKKKRKVAKQLISFEDDDCSILSSSIPSSSSSITSETNSAYEISSKTSLKSVKMEDNRERKSSGDSEKIESQKEQTEKEKPHRKLSIETSGSRDKYPTVIEGTLTPVHSNIGELTPISVEKDSPNVSEEAVEMPTDISAMMTALEMKNNEEINRLKEKVSTLDKENESLKEQLKKYIGAVQMLKRDDQSLQKALDGLQIQEHPNYKDEAKLYESKLVQVAEMHAELMDFNVILQQNLHKKDALLERLKSELEELRGPMPSDELAEDSQSSVNVWIPSAFLTGSGSDAHHVYQIFLRAGNDEWNIYRRYAQFYALHTDLKKLDPVVNSFDFPPKKSIGKKDSALVEDRRKRLQKYLRRVILHWPELSHCNTRYLLEQHLGFFKDNAEGDKKKSTFSTTSRRSANHYTGL